MNKAWMDATLDVEARIRLLLAEMTVEEKIAQTTQINNVGPQMADDLRAGSIGSSLFGSGAWAGNIADDGSYAHGLNAAQKIAVEESRLGIPILFGRDVIHGFRTVAPIPLAQAASWNLALVETAAADAAREAAAVGLHWTFTPMLDISRDPRWGRIIESAGEDPYLTAAFARASVKGYQGDDLAHPEKIAACAKHFCGYGGSEAGRDYNTVDFGPRSLQDIYLPSFKAAVEAGVATFMTSFNEIDGVPSTASRELLTDILRTAWGFDGFVVSDWNAVQELVDHGLAADNKGAAQLAIHAGTDMCMVCDSYKNHLAALIEEGAVALETLDEAVRRILRVKFRLGIFERPYADLDCAASVLLRKDHIEHARALARESMVLLKNENETLPITPGAGTKYLVCGPMIDAKREMFGSWTLDGFPDTVTSFAEALPEYFSDDDEFLVKRMNDEALLHARHSDAVIVCLGESHTRSGEAMSTTTIELPAGQQAFLDALHRWKIPLIAVVFAGRPTDMRWLEEHAAAILYAWHPGIEGPRAALDLLTGKESPSGRLPVSFPRCTGQIPVYYNHKNTGRPIAYPKPGSASPQLQRYNDEFDSPLFPFGFGLSYTTFAYSDLKLEAARVPLEGEVAASVTVRNSGAVAAKEVVQLYVRDLIGSVTRPVKELKRFEKISLAPGESRTLRFTFPVSALAFTTLSMEKQVEPGTFKLWIGPHSDAGLEAEFTVG